MSFSPEFFEDLDSMSLPKGWTHEKIVREAVATGTKIRSQFSKSGVVLLGPNEVEHLTTLLGYLAKHSEAYSEALRAY